ncbi:MAG: AMP-binding protein, partial [Fidelibacterota bacterium]
MKFIDLLKKKSEKHPETVYIFFRDKKVTFNKFELAVLKLASGLKSLGLEKGDRVGIILPNIPQFPISYHAVLSIGAAAIPINIMSKYPEIRYQMEDSEARAVIFWEGFIHEVLKGVEGLDTCEILISLGKRKYSGIHNFSRIIENSPPFPNMIEVSENDTAVIIYTAGTTGNPRGAELSFRNIYSNAKACSKLLPLTEMDIILGVIPLFHSFGLTAVMNLALITGSSIALLPRFDIEEVLSAISRYRITVFIGVPSMYAQILEYEGAEGFPLSSVKYWIAGGAPFPVEVMEEFEKKFSAVILEGYGLSEASPVVSFNRNYARRKVGSVGLPLDNISMKIVDDSGKELPVGQVGEIVVKGPNVMKGYLNRPEATSRTIKEGWLRTGDLAYMDEDGYYFIVDRKTDMIVKSGFNIYPKEVENILNNYPKIAESAVIGIPSRTYGEEV